VILPDLAAALLRIGEFSRATHLSVKALRHYHDVGVLAPAAIDPDPAARNREIAAHLERMERQLAQTRAAVSGLRALLSGPAPRPAIEFRTIPPVTVLAITEMVAAADALAWGSAAFAEITAAAGTARTGPLGALFPGEFFELERGEIIAFVPVTIPLTAHGGRGGQQPGGRVRLTEIAGTEAAVAVHDGPAGDIDRSYGALGTAVAERSIGVGGPIREYYPDGFSPDGQYRTEICWPVFLTSRP
jgi:effector-binding domain-containing protein